MHGEITESFRKDVRTEPGLEAKKARKWRGEGKNIHAEGTVYRGTEARRVEEHGKCREPKPCWRKRTWHGVGSEPSIIVWGKLER